MSSTLITPGFSGKMPDIERPGVETFQRSFPQDPGKFCTPFCRLWRSVKYEDIYLKGYATLSELLLGLTEYFAFYNGERPHQFLDNRTPDAVYHAGAGGGASIVDRFGGTPEPTATVSGDVGEGLAADLAA